MADPEIDILWRGEWVIRDCILYGSRPIGPEEEKDLELLLLELLRIRQMRVARWNARRRARQKKSAAARQELRRVRADVEALMRKPRRTLGGANASP